MFIINIDSFLTKAIRLWGKYITTMHSKIINVHEKNHISSYYSVLKFSEHFGFYMSFHELFRSGQGLLPSKQSKLPKYHEVFL